MTQTLSKIQNEILVGILLGDANLGKNENGRKYRLRVLQSTEHKEYVYHLYDVFKEFVKTPPKNQSASDSKRDKVYNRTYFNTSQQECFLPYAKLFYKIAESKTSQTKKCIPESIINLITPRGLAYWYMDDGAQKWKEVVNSVCFCTDRYSEEEVLHLIFVLKSKFDLQCTPQKKNGKLRIGVSTKSYDKLTDLIYPYILPTMRNKYPSKQNLLLD